MKRTVMVAALALAAMPVTAGAQSFTAKPAAAPSRTFTVVDERRVPAARLPAVPSFLRPWDPSPYSFPLSIGAPWSAPGFAVPETGGGRLAFQTFDGLGAPWPYFVARPDQSIAAGPGGILQMINGGLVALFDSNGRYQPSWPKDAGQFFGLTRGQPFVDHRAVYDSWDRRYWLVSGNQLDPLVHVAVSQTSDPNGKWNVYGFDVEQSPKQLWDFNMFGLDRTTVSFATHLFTFKNNRISGLTNAAFVFGKAPLESGAPHAQGSGYTNIVVDGKAPSSLEPALVGTESGALPPGELFVATADTQPCAFSPRGCTTMYVFTIAPGGTLSLARVATPPYAPSPLASTPSCASCLETVGPMMATPPVYHGGRIYFAFGVGVPDYRHGRPAVFWGELQPQFSGSAMGGATLVDHGTVALAGRDAAFLPSVMDDAAGNFYLLFDGSGPALDPSVYVALHRTTDPPGRMSATALLRRGSAPPPTGWYGYKFFPYGDYTAASYDPSSGVWLSSQYAQSNAAYGSAIAHVRP
jgi:hypothetical protein